MIPLLQFLLGAGISLALVFAGLWLLLVYPYSGYSLKFLWIGLGAGLVGAAAFVGVVVVALHWIATGE